MDESNERAKGSNPDADSSNSEISPRSLTSKEDGAAPSQETDNAAEYIEETTQIVRAAGLWIWRRLIVNSGFWQALATIVIAITTVVYTIYAKKQWQAMSDQLTEMRRQSDLQFKIAEGSQAATLMPSQQALNRNLLSFGIQNMGAVGAENVTVTVEIELLRLADSRTLWTESFAFEQVKYLAPKQNTNGQGEKTVSRYTRQDFYAITKAKETLVLNWTATYDNGFARRIQQSGCAQYLALFRAPQVAAIPQWVSCEGAPQLLRGLQPPSEQWSLQ